MRVQPFWLTFIGLLTLYVLSGRVAMQLESVSRFATMMWPPAGLALAALVLFDLRLWPAIFIGALAVEISVGVPFITACTMAFGSTLGALSGAFFLVYFLDFNPRMKRLKDVLGLLFFCAFFSSMISATIGTSSLLLSGQLSPERFVLIWRTWWVGDALGDLIVAPLLMVWIRRSFSFTSVWRLIEAVCLLSGTAIATMFAFSRFVHLTFDQFPLTYVVFPFVIWSAIRFSQTGAVTTSFMIWSIAVWVSGKGLGPFAKTTPDESIFFLQAFHAVVAMTGMVLAATVTERKQALRALRRSRDALEEQMLRRTESEQYFRDLADSIPQLVWIANNQGYILWYNRRWYEYTGTTFEKMQHEGWGCVHRSEELTEVIERWQSSLQSGEPFEMEFQLRKTDGSYRWFLSRVTPVRNGYGQITRWFGTNTDIDEQKRIQEDLARAINARDEFVSIASHELKTPLTSLKLQIQMRLRALRKGMFSALEQSRLLRMFEDDEKQINRLNRLVDDMLDISRLRLKKMNLLTERIELRELVEEVIERFLPQIQASVGTVTVESDGPAVGYWDHYRMEQVFTNLLTNSLKYGKKQPVNIKISADPHYVYLTIIDHGIGIDAKDYDRIFRQFERAVSANEVSGLGLGLFIVKQIIDAHNATISVTSELGKGSVFSIQLPKIINGSEPLKDLEDVKARPVLVSHQQFDQQQKESEF